MIDTKANHYSYTHPYKEHNIFYQFNYNCFCLNQLVCLHYKTIHKTTVSFHLVYRYIFCLPNRHLMRIIMRELNIIYSFISLGDTFFTRKLCSYVSCSAFSWSSFTRQHVPDFSFSLVCILQVCFSSIDMRDTPHHLL